MRRGALHSAVERKSSCRHAVSDSKFYFIFIIFFDSYLIMIIHAWLHSSWIEEVRICLLLLRSKNQCLELGVCCFMVSVLLVCSVMYVDFICLLMCTNWQHCVLISAEGIYFRILVLGFRDILCTSQHVH